MFCVHMTRYANSEALVEALWRTLTLGRPSDGGRCGAAYAVSYTAARKIFESILDFTRPRLLPHFRSTSIAFIAMCDALRGWRFCILGNEYVGMVPFTSRQGDIIVVLLGFGTPFVVRRIPSSKPDRCWFIGECYIHGIMNGEALKHYSINFQDFLVV